jgi:hypothetical protein
MRIGLQVPSFTWPGGPAAIAPKLAAIARAADDAGLLLVKAATTLDVLSGGRSYFALGAAWFEGEAKGLGVPFPPIAERFEWLEEALRIAKQMWSDTDARFDGEHYHLERTLCRPQPLQRPHPPILIAGGGEKKTLRLVAQYGDACNLFGSPEMVVAKLAILREHCDRIGRNYDAIEKTAIGTVEVGAGKLSPSELIAQCKALAAAGVQHVIFNMPNVHEIAPLEVFGREIIPAVAGF